MEIGKCFSIVAILVLIITCSCKYTITNNNSSLNVGENRADTDKPKLHSSELHFPLTTKECVAVTDVILIGKVTSKEVRRWPGGPIYTYFTVNVTEWLKGNPGSNNVVIRVLGGTIGDVTETVSDGPVGFRVGEQAMIFLKRNSDGTLDITSCRIDDIEPCHVWADQIINEVKSAVVNQDK